VSAVRSRNKPSLSLLYLQQLSWVTIIIPIPPRFQKDIIQNYFETHSKQLSPRFSRVRKHYTYMSTTIKFYVTCNDFLSKGMWLEFWSHNQSHTLRWKFYQMKPHLESTVQLRNQQFWAELIKLTSLFHSCWPYRSITIITVKNLLRTDSVYLKSVGCSLKFLTNVYVSNCWLTNNISYLMCGYCTLYKKFPLYKEHELWVMMASVPITHKTAFQLTLNKSMNNCHSSVCVEISNFPSIYYVKAIIKTLLKNVTKQTVFRFFS
jgi:hypothetical protein